MQKKNTLLVLITVITVLISGCISYDSGQAKSGKTNVKLGIENIKDFDSFFKDKKLGLLTNPTGINSKLESTIDILAKNYKLVALYSPEHGIRGDAQAGDEISSSSDAKTGLKIYSLYGPAGGFEPTKNMLSDIDYLCYDIQDVGARFYTYISTMGNAMNACKKNNKTFVVLDRPNPLGGNIIEGAVMEKDYESFVGMYPIPIRYGLTCGELARFINTNLNINCELYVIPLKGWTRNMYWSDTNLPWIQPSPNIPTPDTAIVYPGTCLFEGTNVSEGRGTTKPFEQIGAPWIKSSDLSDKLNSLNLPGVLFSPAYFTPTFSKYKGEICGGVCLHIRNKETFRPVTTAVAMIDTIKEMYNDKFEWRKPENDRWWIDLLTGSSQLREEDLSYEELINDWNEQSEKFKNETQQFYLYNE